MFSEYWENGGIESFLTGVLLRQDPAEMGFDIVVTRQSDSLYTESVQKYGARLIPLSGSSRRIFRNWALFRRLLRENKYDVLYVNAFQALSLRYALLAKRAGVPVRILHSHSNGLRVHYLRPLKLLIHSVCRQLYGNDGTELFACSREAGEFLFPARLQPAVRFLPNGIETERFRFCGAEREAFRVWLGLEGAFVLGHIGRLCDQKNQMFLLDVLKAILPLRPESRLLLVGEGDRQEALKRRVRELDIQDQVVFCGVTDQPERFLWAMDIFLFPSLFEGLGIAAVEAQCAGLTVFCSEHVPEQTRITELAKLLPLTAGAEAWAREAAKQHCNASRENYAAAVKRAGFDVEDVSRELRTALLASPPGRTTT